MMTYSNRWIPDGALDILRHEKGTILDVGGGAAPFAGATHILDMQLFNPTQLAENSWGDDVSGRSTEWLESDYTQLDLCSGTRWPFQDKEFDLGLCSHTLEDLRDPLPALAELQRVCKRVLVIAPSRLLEQTRGIDHPRFCGFLASSLDHRWE